jgi:hypothetical protein
VIQLEIKKAPTVNTLVALTPVLIKLYEYFTKNAGLNTVTGAAGGSLLTLVLLGMQTATYDQMIAFLQNNGEYGIIAGAVFAALRMFVVVYVASKPNKQ